MSKRSKATADPDKRDSKGEHGGNRGGDRKKKDGEPPKRSSQAAGKDPQRGSSKD